MFVKKWRCLAQLSGQVEAAAQGRPAAAQFMQGLATKQNGVSGGKTSGSGDAV